MQNIFEKNIVLQVIEDQITPFIGKTMAQASTGVHCQNLGIVKDEVTKEEVDSLLDRIGKAMLVFVGEEKSERLLQDIYTALGMGGETP